MTKKLQTVIVGIGCTAALMFLIYALMVLIACITMWSNDYWNLANWEGAFRLLLAMMWFGAGFAGSIATYCEVVED